MSYHEKDALNERLPLHSSQWRSWRFALSILVFINTNCLLRCVNQITFHYYTTLSDSTLRLIELNIKENASVISKTEILHRNRFTKFAAATSDWRLQLNFQHVVVALWIFLFFVLFIFEFVLWIEPYTVTCRHGEITFWRNCDKKASHSWSSIESIFLRYKILIIFRLGVLMLCFYDWLQVCYDNRYESGMNVNFWDVLEGCKIPFMIFFSVNFRIEFCDCFINKTKIFGFTIQKVKITCAVAIRDIVYYYRTTISSVPSLSFFILLVVLYIDNSHT